MAKIFDIAMDRRSGIPKYRQIMAGIQQGIRIRRLRRGDRLPSVNTLCRRHSLSRDTVIKAYDKLKLRGWIDSVHGKGFYVATDSIREHLRIFLLFDELSPYKQVLYQSFTKTLHGKATAEMYFHHYNIDTFQTLILNSMGKYDIYVVMPFDQPQIPGILKKLGSDRLLILDRNEQVDENYPCLYQDFETGIYEGLSAAVKKIKKYQRLILVFPQPSEHPVNLIKGFKRFCRQFDIRYKVVHNLSDRDIRKEMAYVVIDDCDLVHIVERCKQQHCRLGREIGLISYNDTPMKKIVGSGGVTVISTDFARLGLRAAEKILTGDQSPEVNPTRLHLRRSL